MSDRGADQTEGETDGPAGRAGDADAAQAGRAGRSGRAPLVLDAAVATKLVLPEELSGRAQALVEAAIGANRRVVGPPLLTVEVANAIYAQRRNDEITGGEADAAMAAYLRLGIDPVSPGGLDRAAFAFARAHRLRSVHSAHYIVLAQLLETELWTGDRALLKSAASVAPWVCWIGDFSDGG